ncbi:putative O-glycosylation ligase, exosortase A system-associated [Salinisphaera aquimarina]|uniref:O-glycosylation ligase, exosortase A system-associated n=1 Tax=Salinisphaera aquimarina TaxID=2094031 RepID=A0ABV7EQ44_9GAMM
MRALALLMFLAATLPMAFMRPIVGLMLWIMFSYMNPHRIAYGFATSFNWVMITALVTILVTLVHRDQRQPLRMTPVMVAMTLFLIWTGVTTIFAVESDLARAEWVRFFKILLMAYFTLILVIDRQKLHWVLWAVVISFGFWGFKGGLFTLLTGGGYHVLGPIKSFFRDNNDFALVMCMTLPLIRYLQLQEPKRLVRLGLWALMALTALSVLGTQSRGGFLALGVTGIMLIYKSRHRKSLILVVPVLAIALAAFMPQEWYDRMNTINQYQEDQSAQGRIDSYKFATSLALSNPILGGGMRVWANQGMWNMYGPPGAKHRAIHSIFFEVLGEHSFIGLILFIGMLVTAWLSLARIRKRTRGSPELAWMGDLASMMQVSLVAYMGAGSLLPMPYFDLFYQLLAITAVLNVMVERAARGVVDESMVLSRPETEMTTATSPQPARRRRRSFVSDRQATGGKDKAAPASRNATQNLPWW